MPVDVWFRNPHLYIKELAEVGHSKIVWDRGILVKKRIDAVKHALLYFGTQSDFELLLVGQQGTAHLDKDHPLTKPLAVYPTWSPEESLDLLEEMMAYPLGEDSEACEDESLKPDQRPVFGQKHMVIVQGLPNATHGTSRSLFRHIRTLAEDYPKCILHVHGTYSFRVAFGMGFGSADLEPRQDAANGRVIIPAGKAMRFEKTMGCPQWVNLLGFQVVDLKVPRNRCIYNIKSAIWAGEHWDENLRFKTRGPHEVNPQDPTLPVPTTTRNGAHTAEPRKIGDMVICDQCSLSKSCKYFREGAVCSVPGSETSPLAKAFQSRDSSKIIDGLGTVLSAQTRRAEKAMEFEEEFGELDPEVTKILNQIFTNGVKLAKILDPNLTKPGVSISIGGGSGQQLNQNQLMAQVVRGIEANGVAREDITPQMVEAKIREMAGLPPMIEVRSE